MPLTNPIPLSPPDDGRGENILPGALEVGERFDGKLVLVTILSRLINCKFECIDEAIQGALGVIGRHLGAEKGVVFVFSDETRERLHATHSWFAEGLPTAPRILDGLETDGFPWLMERLNRLENVPIRRAGELPEKACTERKVLESLGVRSALVVPLVQNGSLAGALAVSTFTKETVWSEEMITFLNSTAEIISSVLERKRRETAIGRRTEEFRILFDTTPIPTVVIDSHARIHRANRAAQEFFDQPEAAVIGRKFGDAFNCCDGREGKSESGHCQKAPSCALFSAIQEGFRTRTVLHGMETDLTVRRGEGFEPRSFQFNIAFLERRESPRLIISFEDITERVRAAKEIARQKALLDRIVFDVREGMGIVDENENILFCNPSFAAILESDAESLLGRSIMDFFDDESREIILKQTGMRMSGHSTTYQLPCKTAKGNVKHIRVTASPRFRTDDSFAGTFAVVIEISPKKRTGDG